MSTLLKKCILQDPKGDIDFVIESKNEFTFNGENYTIENGVIKKANDSVGLTLGELITFPKCDDYIPVLLGDKTLGYILGDDVQWLRPFYNHKFTLNCTSVDAKNLLSIGTIRLDPNTHRAEIRIVLIDTV